MKYLGVILCLGIIICYSCSNEQIDGKKNLNKIQISKTKEHQQPKIDKAIPKKDHRALANFKKHYLKKNIDHKKDKQVYKDYLSIKDKAEKLGKDHLRFFLENYNINKLKKLNLDKSLSIPLSQDSHSARLAKKYDCKDFLELKELITKLINSIRYDEPKYGAHLAKKHHIQYDFSVIKKIQSEFSSALKKDLGLASNN